MRYDELSVIKLLNYGWPDRVIANYLDIKKEIVCNYRKKYGIIAMNDYEYLINK